ncbi:DUF1178 family protein [Pseudaquabacterium pictum]|uniref:DUF1178 domain-containing protein n=1 Tax=Pseudaquabacterium pictum TaxID=2315236 RepID=A0A480APK4_9BURK|nr:DUF1178 family protein [Rubrivivax pictus]GCL62012.1 hypothetical protein AQPW35_10930 [Rubrivivax pictus]
MKVLNLRCDHDHAFEGWFASEADFQDQASRGVVACPLCGSLQVHRLPSAPRLNLSGAREPDAPASAAPESAAPPQATLQAQWLQAVAQVLQNTEDVGERFPEEARRIHYGEAPHRGIRGQASADERAELADEGIEVVPLPVPVALKGTAH